MNFPETGNPKTLIDASTSQIFHIFFSQNF